MRRSASTHELPVAPVPLVDAGAAPAAGVVPLAPAPTRQGGASLQQPGGRSRSVFGPPLASARAACLALDRVLGAAVRRRTPHRPADAAVDPILDHAGDGRVPEH